MPLDDLSELTYRCPLCRQTFVLRYDYDPGGDGDTGPCPKCGRTIDFGELEAVEAFYLLPIIACHNCRTLIELPYPHLSQTDEAGKALPQGEDPPRMPPEEWSATFGCLACGKIATYFAGDAGVGVVRKWKEGIYQSGKGVYRIEFPCGDRRCKAPVSMYVDTGNRSGSEAVAAIREGVFDGKIAACGHEIKTVPAKYYTVEPAKMPLW